MASRGGRGAGRGRRGGGNASIIAIAQKMGTTATEIRKNVKASYEPEPLFPAHLVPRPTKLSQDEIDMVKYYRGLRTRILEDTPFYIIPKKRQIDDDEDDGIRRYRDKYKPKKSSVQGLRALPVGMSSF
jgi:DNA-directed RNA polymerase III subunit Rpc31